MARNLDIDTSALAKGFARLEKEFKAHNKKGLGKVADEVLRLSSFQVPHDTGLLQNSGHIEEETEGFIVGYNKVYAARLHEHPEYNFQNGRKGKYLEDPIKNNLSVLLDFYGNIVKQLFA